LTLASSLAAAWDTGFLRMMTGSQSWPPCMVAGGWGGGRVGVEGERGGGGGGGGGGQVLRACVCVCLCSVCVRTR
jgi:hypothetical protein